MTTELPRYRSRLVHLTAVWAYGVSQPIFVLIDGNPELLLSRGLSRLEIVVFAVLLAVVPPLLAMGYAWLAGRVSAWVGAWALESVGVSAAELASASASAWGRS